MTVTTANSARDTEAREATENIFSDARSRPPFAIAINKRADRLIHVLETIIHA